MNLNHLLDQFLGAGTAATPARGKGTSIGAGLGSLAGRIPGGLVGGAAAGSIMALLVSNKSARKFAGTAASYGGAAILGGLAYKALKTWQHNSANQEAALPPEQVLTPDFELRLIKAMIAAARADGHIDSAEQQHIFQAVERMALSAEMKGMVFDLLNQSITIDELAAGVTDMTQKSELYLASTLVIDHDHPEEQAHLARLADALALPPGLTRQIQRQASQAISEVV